jgi:arylsulfatase A-like enzyme
MAGQKKPNIVMIMADDVGTWNLSAYHRGMMGGRRPTSTGSPEKVPFSLTTTVSSHARRAARLSSPARVLIAQAC